MVSTEGQPKRASALRRSGAKIEAYATLKDLTLVEVIEDAGISAKSLKRPGMQRLLEIVHRGEVEAVVILKLDRMFRNTVDALQTTQGFDKKGVALHSIQESLDTQSAMGRFFFTLLAAIGEMERGVIGERTRTALARKKEKGEVISRFAPFGYQRRGNKLVPSHTEQAAMAIMRRLKDAGKSYQQVADALNKKGIVTKNGGTWDRVRVFKAMKVAA
jgi:DNA invertase Pin-like site-specific DNA recombinase